jgi:hypothetical protein
MQVLETLLNGIRSEKARFGLLRNDHDQMLEELQESYSYAKASAALGGQFNFSIVI